MVLMIIKMIQPFRVDRCWKLIDDTTSAYSRSTKKIYHGDSKITKINNAILKQEVGKYVSENSKILVYSDAGYGYEDFSIIALLFYLPRNTANNLENTIHRELFLCLGWAVDFF